MIKTEKPLYSIGESATVFYFVGMGKRVVLSSCILLFFQQVVQEVIQIVV